MLGTISKLPAPGAPTLRVEAPARGDGGAWSITGTFPANFPEFSGLIAGVMRKPVDESQPVSLL